MEENTAGQHKKQKYEWLKKYQWKPGQSGNPAGAKPGKKLKTRVAELLMKMTDEEMKAFLEEVSPELVWKMAEGNPITETTIGNKDGKPFIIKVEPELAEQNGLDASTINNSTGQEPVQGD